MNEKKIIIWFIRELLKMVIVEKLFLVFRIYVKEIYKFGEF